MITPTMPPAVVDSQVCTKLRPMPNDRAGAIRNLMLLTKKTINILMNPDKVIMLSYSNETTLEMLLHFYKRLQIIFKWNFRPYYQRQGRRHRPNPEQYIPEL